VILPTYEEYVNVRRMVEALIEHVPDVHEIIVVDDDSPDDTASVVREMMADIPVLKLIHRTQERGLTSAIRDGVLASTGDPVVWMDSDLSMHPADLPNLLRAIEEGADVAIGSRFVPGGRDVRDVKLHKLLSVIINWFGRMVLKENVRDCSSGFIAIRRHAVAGFGWEGDWGEYFIKLIQHAIQSGFVIAEVPYTLYARTVGESKTATTPLDFFLKGRKYVWTIVKLRFRPYRRTAQVSLEAADKARSDQ
jgi:dolichol-phosphate mannosyltransferase